jgi:hypothetical protein
MKDLFFSNFLKKVWRIFWPDDEQEEIEALEATVAYLEKRKSIISAQLTICRWELTRKKQFRKLVD